MYGWHSVPKHLTISYDEAKEIYGHFGTDQVVFGLYDEETGKEESNPDERVLMRGTRRRVVYQYTHLFGPNSRTIGGYSVVVIERYLRKRYPKLKGKEFFPILRNDVNMLLDKLEAKHEEDLHDRTRDAVLNHLRGRFEWDDYNYD